MSKVTPIDILEMHSGLSKSTIEISYKWVIAAMNEYGSRCAIEATQADESSDSDKDKEIADLKHAVDSFESMAKEFKQEIERLKGLIEMAYDYAREHHFTRHPDKTWQQFKTGNNL